MHDVEWALGDTSSLHTLPVLRKNTPPCLCCDTILTLLSPLPCWKQVKAAALFLQQKVQQANGH